MLDTIESAIEDIKAGKLVIVVDDEDRENEGDFLTAARNVTPEIINFMSREGRGLICAPLIEERCDELQLELMVNSNTSLHATPFTVSIDLLGMDAPQVFRPTTALKRFRHLYTQIPNPKTLAARVIYFRCGLKRVEYCAAPVIPRLR